MIDQNYQESGVTPSLPNGGYTGLPAPLILKSIPDLQPAFDEFVRCLKTAAERRG